MRFFILLLLNSLLLLATSLSAHAVQESHGGGGVVCRDATGKILSARLLDFWEAETLGYAESNATAAYSLAIAPSTDDEWTQAQAVIGKLKSVNAELGDLVAVEHTLNQGRLNWINPGLSLVPPSDAPIEFMAKGCSLEGIASFNDATDTLSIDPELYQALSATDRAGLWIHEAVYKVFRSHLWGGETDSTRSRRFTAHLFSNYPFATNVRADIDEHGVRCQGPGVEVYLYRYGLKNYRLQFIQIFGDWMLERTVVDVADPDGRIATWEMPDFYQEDVFATFSFSAYGKTRQGVFRFGTQSGVKISTADPVGPGAFPRSQVCETY